MSERTLPGSCLFLMTALIAIFATSQGFCDCSTLLPLGTPSTVSTNPNPHGIAVGDFDSDGFLDLAVANSAGTVPSDSGRVSVFRGAGNGTFTLIGNFRAGFKPYDVQVADLNRDGRWDLVTADFSGNSVTTLLGQGNGTFVRKGIHPAGANPFTVAIADFDRDSIPDVAVTLNGSAGAVLLRGLGNGGLGPAGASLNVGGHPAGSCTGDFNQDGAPDLAVAGYDAHAIYVCLGNGNGTFQVPVAAPVSGQAWGVVSIDQNADGRLDLVATTSSGFTIDLLLGQGNGGFASRIASTIGSNATGIALGDFDHDGKADAIVGLASDGRVQVMHGTGSLSPPFSPTIAVAVAGTPIAVAVGDFNRDGILDAVTGNYSANTFAYIPGVCSPPPNPAEPIVNLWAAAGRAIVSHPGLQSDPISCTDEAGGAYVVWRDDRGGSGLDLYGTHIDLQGNTAPGWTPGGDALCVASSDPSQHKIVPDGQGGAIVAWQDSRTATQQLYALRLMPSSPTHPAWLANGVRISADNTSPQTLTGLASDRVGGGYFAWKENRIGQIYAMRRSAEGAVPDGWDPGGNALGYSFVPPNTIAFDKPSLATDAAGGAFVGYSATGNCPPPCTPFGYVEVDRISPDGTVAHGPQINAGSYPYFDEVHLYPDGAGGTVMDYQMAFRVARFSPQLQLVWGNLLVGFPYSPSISEIVPDGANGVFLGTERSRNTTYEERSIHLQRLAASGNPSVEWSQQGIPIADGPGHHLQSRLISDGQGGAVRTWLDSPSSDWQLYGQHANSTGGLPTGSAANGTLLCSAPGTRLSQTLTPSVGPSAIVIWQDTRTDGGDIYAQRIAWDAVVPVAYSLASADAFLDRTEVRWFAPGDSREVAVQRHRSGYPWVSLARVSPDGSGLIRFVDRDVRSGEHLGYRLLVSDDGSPAGEAWVDVPVAAQLALNGTFPNPSSGPLQVSFSLASHGPASIELFDIAGRRVDGRSVGELGPGQHEITLGSRSLSAGIYLIRLEQSARVIVRRAMIVR